MYYRRGTVGGAELDTWSQQFAGFATTEKVRGYHN